MRTGVPFKKLLLTLISLVSFAPVGMAKAPERIWESLFSFAETRALASVCRDQAQGNEKLWGGWLGIDVELTDIVLKVRDLFDDPTVLITDELAVMEWSEDPAFIRKAKQEGCGEKSLVRARSYVKDAQEWFKNVERIKRGTKPR